MKMDSRLVVVLGMNRYVGLSELVEVDIILTGTFGRDFVLLIGVEE